MDTASRYDGRMMERLNLPRLATLALALLIGLQLAWIVTGALGSHVVAGPGVAGSGASGGVGSAPVSGAMDTGLVVVGRIAAARLFGESTGRPGAPTDGGGAVPPSSLALVLAGVFAREDPGAGRAIIGETAATGRLYGVGATLPGGARLTEVHPDRVILERGGQREALTLPRSSMPAQPSTSGATNVPALAPTASSSPSASPSPPGASIAEDPARFIRWQAMLRDGQVAGVRVYPGEQTVLFTRSGLRPGDLVVAVNDSPLTDQATAAQFLRMLAGAPSSVVTVERDGRTENLSIDLARLGQAGAK
jgi:general secretion pathway protein C